MRVRLLSLAALLAGSVVFAQDQTGGTVGARRAAPEHDRVLGQPGAPIDAPRHETTGAGARNDQVSGRTDRRPRDRDYRDGTLGRGGRENGHVDRLKNRKGNFDQD